jgi:cytochrome b561
MEKRHYDRVASALHWLIGIALLGQIGFGFLLDEIAPRGTPSRGEVINLHKSIGIVLGLLILARLAWRLAHRPPAWPAAMPAWQRRAARLSHGALYLCMGVMPVSGYIASNFSKRGVKFFGVMFEPWGPDLPAVYQALNLLHVVTAWVFTALIALHVAAALRHALVDRDGIFMRIWPWSSAAAPRRGASRAST